MKKWIIVLLVPLIAFTEKKEEKGWIRVNLLGYTPRGVKVAVWCGKEQQVISNWQLIDAKTNTTVFAGKAGNSFGAYGPFTQTYRLNFSAFKKKGRYYLQAGDTKSPEFAIGDDVYKGAADFCLRYMRQQRSGFNPYLKDSCHTHDGYVLYGEKTGIKDSTHIDVVGGWHDASDYLQYSTTSANATYHLLMAYRDFPTVFTDEKLANGLDGKNGMADVLDEAKWGLDWLLKMHPKKDWMFNQVGDDRDHQGMRIPKEDSFYGRGYERPVYFVSGEPQQRGKFMNNTTGTSSTAGKFASAFALGSYLLRYEKSKRPWQDKQIYSDSLYNKARSAFSFGFKKQGVSQTASVRSPYIYAEDNWTDDMELAAVSVYNATGGHFKSWSLITLADSLAGLEPVTPWLNDDTANHYQWYPFINIGHYELAKKFDGKKRKAIIGYYKEGLQRVWNRARSNAFYRGVPFIWCSNNLTVSFAIQCYWYRELTGDKTFSELEQANFDWLFGCNPWGTSMVYGLPTWGDTPVDPHSAFTHLKNYPIDGGLVDGPVYGSIYKSLIGIQLKDTDEYSAFQSNLAVYHDDYGDYSTNEPTMDGTASLIYLLAAKETESPLQPPPRGEAYKESFKKRFSYSHGATIRGDSTKKNIALVFTGDEYAEGADSILNALKGKNIKASFFFTGRFYENPAFKKIVQRIKKEGHYLGPHSNKHLLYCDWSKRDSLLLSKAEFSNDLLANLKIMRKAGINTSKSKFFLPPYEWYNDTIAAWTKELGLQLINFTPGTKSHADYTWPDLKNYQSTDSIFESIGDYQFLHSSELNGFILLMHIGTDPRRTDKFYEVLPQLLSYLIEYQLQTVDQLLKE